MTDEQSTVYSCERSTTVFTPFNAQGMRVYSVYTHALYTVYTLYTLYTVYTVYTVYTRIHSLILKWAMGIEAGKLETACCHFLAHTRSL